MARTVGPLPIFLDSLVGVLTFNWTASDDPSVVGYRIYGDPYTPPNTLRVSVGLVTTAQYTPPDTGWYFAISSVNTEGIEGAIGEIIHDV